MSIEFHCEHCGMLVRTASTNAGKRGKCPGCHQSIYVPTAGEEIEPLELAPIDPEAEASKRRLEEEGRRVAEQLRADRTEIPPESAKTPLPVPTSDPRLELDMETLVIEYVLAMADGRLDEAEQYATDIRTDWDAAEDVIQRLTMDDMPPRRLKSIPHAVLVGFLRQLRANN